MADRVSASIELGGVLSALDYIKLTETIVDEGLSVEWDGEPFEAHHRIEGQTLHLFAHQVANGQFTELEALCVTIGLPFSRWSGAYSGKWGAERVVFTGEGDPQSYAADDDEYVVIGRESVENSVRLRQLLPIFMPLTSRSRPSSSTTTRSPHRLEHLRPEKG